jgi:hypothetical protein
MIRAAMGLMILFCVAAAGCNRGGSTYTLSGTVSYQNARLTQGRVAAFGEDGVPVSCDIQPDGTYHIEKCPSGRVRLAVVSPDPKPAAEMRARMAESGRAPKTNPNQPAVDPNKWFPIPEKYNLPDTSELEVEVSGDTVKDIKMD